MTAVYPDKLMTTHHVVQGWCIQDSDIAITGDIISLKNYDHVTVLFDMAGIATNADANLTFWASTDVAGTGAVQIEPISYRQMLTTTDTWSDASEIGDGNLNIGTHIGNGEDCNLVVCEFDARQINNENTSDNLDCFQARMSAPGVGSNVVIGAIYILWPGCRYARENMPSAIVD